MNIYIECQPSAKGGSHSTGGRHAKPSHPAQSTGPQTSVAPPSYTQPKAQVKVSHKTKRALAHSGKDKKALTNLINPNYVDTTHLHTVLASSPSNASLSSTFDLGSGPIILLVLLAGSVLSLLGTGGVRAWRGRHRA